jgi:hypothetical protein
MNSLWINTIPIVLFEVCPFVEFIQIGSLNVSMRIMIDFAEQNINS